MTETEKVVAKFVSGFGGDRYKKVFDLLESKNLKPLGKSNTATLLFQQRISANEVNDIFAFRLGPPSVISFPKSYWLKRSTDLSTFFLDLVTQRNHPFRAGFRTLNILQDKLR